MVSLAPMCIFTPILGPRLASQDCHDFTTMKGMHLLVNKSGLEGHVFSASKGALI